jgi:threonine dehydratase
LELENYGGKLEGVATESSGNHGQALAWAASKFNLKCVVVIPKGAPLAKRNAIEHYGGKLVLCENSMTSRSEELERVAKELSYPVIHPHNAYNTMAGQGTIAVEFLEQVPQLEAVVVSIGGGGMSAGISAYIRAKAPHVKGQQHCYGTASGNAKECG